MNILVTGATGAIGSELARRLDSDGSHIVLIARDEAKLAALAAGLRHSTSIPADLTDASAAQSAIERAWDAAGSLDGFAHCVGSTLVKPLHLTTDGEAAIQLQTNYLSAFYSLRAVVALALKRKHSLSVVLVSSVVAHRGFPNHEAIAAAKGAVAGLAMSAAATYASRGIRVNVVAPGLTRSGLTARFVATAEAEARCAATIPLARIGEPGDPAALIEFLLSQRSAYLTGQVITVAGGQGDLQLPLRASA
jgi:NAD(P)-dependent dehydrogenase (short-subunit alcohol dehydrogenase family)